MDQVLTDDNKTEENIADQQLMKGNVFKYIWKILIQFIPPTQEVD